MQSCVRYAAGEGTEPESACATKRFSRCAIYAGLRAQEACDVQLRDLDAWSGTVTIRHGKEAAVCAA